jgi:hypothetical protein
MLAKRLDGKKNETRADDRSVHAGVLLGAINVSTVLDSVPVAGSARRGGSRATRRAPVYDVLTVSCFAVVFLVDRSP